MPKTGALSRVHFTHNTIQILQHREEVQKYLITCDKQHTEDANTINKAKGEDWELIHLGALGKQTQQLPFFIIDITFRLILFYSIYFNLIICISI